MKRILTLLLVVCVSLATPMAALGAAVGKPPCEEIYAVSSALAAEPIAVTSSGGQHLDHARHLMGEFSYPQDDPSECSHCSDEHCVSGCTTNAAIVGASKAASVKTDARLISFLASNTSAAHSMSLLRPPRLI